MQRLPSTRRPIIHRASAARAPLAPAAATFLALLLAGAGVAPAQQRAATPPRVDWGGGYFKGGDPASSTPATSGAARRGNAARPAPAPASPPRRTDWGGGYFKGGDSASVTPATSGGAERGRDAKR